MAIFCLKTILEMKIIIKKWIIQIGTHRDVTLMHLIYFEAFNGTLRNSQWYNQSTVKIYFLQNPNYMSSWPLWINFKLRKACNDFSINRNGYGLCLFILENKLQVMYLEKLKWCIILNKGIILQPYKSSFSRSALEN